jgi:MarR family transcriptional regulator, transcriptional regulator for hemolysin
MNPPPAEPLGLHVTRVAKVLNRAFDEALTGAGGSLSTWLVLVSVKGRAHAAQRELADAVGIVGPTLTHHLNRMEADGLVTRRRDPANRRVHRVELTEAGEATFSQLLQTVIAFDQQLLAGFGTDELTALRGYLDRLHTNVAGKSV